MTGLLVRILLIWGVVLGALALTDLAQPPRVLADLQEIAR